MPSIQCGFMRQRSFPPEHSRPARARALWIGSIVASLATVQSHATRTGSFGVSAARFNQQGDCKSHGHQPQHGEGLCANDHDQDRRLLPVRNGGQNSPRPATVTSSYFRAAQFRSGRSRACGMAQARLWLDLFPARPFTPGRLIAAVIHSRIFSSWFSAERSEG